MSPKSPNKISPKSSPQKYIKNPSPDRPMLDFNKWTFNPVIQEPPSKKVEIISQKEEKYEKDSLEDSPN